jgi:hypothetical protein
MATHRADVSVPFGVSTEPVASGIKRCSTTVIRGIEVIGLPLSTEPTPVHRQAWPLRSRLWATLGAVSRQPARPQR